MAPRSQEALPGVTVVWFAADPRTSKHVIVGWYRHATVYFSAATIGPVRNNVAYAVCPQVVAAAEDVVLLPPDQRTFQVPHSAGKGSIGFGQNPLWYGAPEFNARVRAYLRRAGAGDSPRREHAPPAQALRRPAWPARSQDAAARTRIEAAAMAIAASYYSDPRRRGRVTDVSDQNKGWDLEVTAPDEDAILKGEVKGLSGTAVAVELTPNEYRAMCSPAHREDHVVFIVTGLAGARPAMHIYRYARMPGRRLPAWRYQRGEVLAITERTSAVLRRAP